MYKASVVFITGVNAFKTVTSPETFERILEDSEIKVVIKRITKMTKEIHKRLIEIAKSKNIPLFSHNMIFIQHEDS